MNDYLADIDEQAQERFEGLVEQLKQAQGITISVLFISVLLACRFDMSGDVKTTRSEVSKRHLWNLVYYFTEV